MVVWVIFCLFWSSDIRWQWYNASLHSYIRYLLLQKTERAKVKLSSCSWSSGKASSPSNFLLPSSLFIPCTSGISLARSTFKTSSTTLSSPSTCKMLRNRVDEKDISYSASRVMAKNDSASPSSPVKSKSFSVPSPKKCALCGGNTQQFWNLSYIVNSEVRISDDGSLELFCRPRG